MWWEYFNWLWIVFNSYNIIPLTISVWLALAEPPRKDMSNVRWYDYYAKGLYLATMVFYLIDLVLRVHEGHTSHICDLALITHHVAAFFIIMPIMVVPKVHWTAIGVAWLHAFLMTFPQVFALNIPYVICVAMFHYNLYLPLYRTQRYFTWTRIFINAMYAVYAVMGLCGCTNELTV
jgi:hypothetical protein